MIKSWQKPADRVLECVEQARAISEILGQAHQSEKSEVSRDSIATACALVDDLLMEAQSLLEVKAPKPS